MKSVLLGGLKVFLVNDGGKPLSAPGGRAKFYKAGTSTPETVYSDIDLTASTALGPVVYTDELGYLPAIWLKTDRLYKVRVEQKVSNDPEQWALLWEVDNVGYIDPHETEEFGEAPIMVDSIVSLKGVDHAEHTRVLVSGYYSAGDWGEPSLFVYDTESTLAVDDGYVVKPNDVEAGAKGRWLQVFSGDVLDVRKFGAIPDLLENSDVTAKVVNAVNYSQRNSTRSRPITVGFVAPGKYEFSGNFDFTIYDFVDLSDNSHHPINWFIGNDVVFKGSYSAFTLSKNTICLSRERLYEGTGCTLSVEGGGAIKVDPAWWGGAPCTITDCIVECHSVTTNSKTFDNCTISSNGFLDGYVTLVGMNFDERWFVDSYTWSHLVLSNVYYDVNDCVSANSYIDIKNSQLDYNYGDLGEQTVTDKVLGSGSIAENAVFNNVTVKGNTELHNVSGTVVVNGNDANLVFVDCWITFSGAYTVNTVSWRRGHIGGGRMRSLGNSSFESVEFVSSFEAIGNSSLTLRNCKLTSGVDAMAGVLDVYGCDLDNAKVTSTAPGSVLTASIRSNRFTGTSVFRITKTYSSGLVFTPNIDILSNFSDHDFFDDTAFDDSAELSQHSVSGGHFVYRDNFGGCPVTDRRTCNILPYSLVNLDDDDGHDNRALPQGQANNTVVLVNDTRRFSYGDNTLKKEFWWCFKINFTFDFEANNVFYCKYFRQGITYAISLDCDCMFENEPNSAFGFCTNKIPIPSFYMTVNGRTTKSFSRNTSYTTQYDVEAMYTNSNLNDRFSRLARFFALGDIDDFIMSASFMCHVSLQG